VTSTSQPLFSTAFKRVLLVTFLGFGMESVLRAIVPLIVLARGGDAVTVGIAATAYAIPALLFRPIVGRLVDTGRHQQLYRGGMLMSGTLPLLLLLPGVLTLALVRFLVGTGWAFFSVANHSQLAKVVPAQRRAEASGVFASMSALGSLFLPALGVALYTATGEVPPILLAVGLGVAGAVVTFFSRVPPMARRASSEPAPPPASRLERLAEPSALPATALLVLSFSSWSLFTVFPPVYVQHLGIPVEVLVFYFPVFGFAQAISLPVFGRLADDLGRTRSMLLGAGMSLAGLALATIPDGLIPAMVTFGAASFLYALGQSFVTPTISALVMERAPRHRIGSAMATYSIGYQFATGTSSILWGAIITSFGFTWVFVVAMAFQVVTIALTRRLLTPAAEPVPA
jgi:MFS family permease